VQPSRSYKLKDVIQYNINVNNSWQSGEDLAQLVSPAWLRLPCCRQVFLILIIDTILYMLLALYIEAVRPGEYGIPKAWYFFCTVSCNTQSRAEKCRNKSLPFLRLVFSRRHELKSFCLPLISSNFREMQINSLTSFFVSIVGKVRAIERKFFWNCWS